MASYKGHLAGGVVSGGAALAGFYAFTLGKIPDGGVLLSDWQLIAGTLIVAALFGLWPDVDTNSKAQDLFFLVALIADLYLIINDNYVSAAILGLVAMTPIVGNHRGWTHKRWAAVIVPLPILLVPYLTVNSVGDTAILLYVSSVAGYLSHLLLDGLIIKKLRVKSRW